jgi:uncharacterized cupredoxin-like copper-binding protein
MARFRIGFLVLVAITAVLAWVIPASAQHSSLSAAKATTVTVTAAKPSEFSFTVAPKRVPHGLVTFKVTNKGALPHDFSIGGRRTKLLSPGQSATLRVTFGKAGKYAYLCTVTGHAAAGMKGTLVVT